MTISITIIMIIIITETIKDIKIEKKRKKKKMMRRKRNQKKIIIY